MSDRHSVIAQLNELTGIFYRRIWASRNLGRWEIFFWSVAALYLSFRVFNYTFWVDDLGFWTVPYYVTLITAPFAIGWMVRNTHKERGEVSELVSTTTIRPSVYVLANWLSVAVSVIRLYLPAAIVFLISHHLMYWYIGPTPMFAWEKAAITQLVKQPYLGIDPRLKIGDGWHADEVINILAVCQTLGWFTLPISWGVWVESRIRNVSRLYVMAYTAFIFIPILNYGMSYILKSRTQLYVPLYGSYAGNDLIVAYVGLSSLVISIVVFFVTVVNKGRRDK